VNELVEEIGGLEIVDDDDENSDDEIDGDEWFCTYLKNSLYHTFNFFYFKHVWKLAPALWSGASTRFPKYPITTLL
jgi:hypothetical protein